MSITEKRAELELKIPRRIRTLNRTEAKLKKAQEGETSRILVVRNDAKKRRDSLNAASLGIFSLAPFLRKSLKKMEIENELAHLKAQAELRKKKVLYRSKLDKFKHPILRLKEAGASLSHLEIFLAEKGVSADRSTISRWLKKNKVDA